MFKRIDTVFFPVRNLEAEPEIASPPGVRFFGFSDQDGNRLEVCWYPEQ